MRKRFISFTAMFFVLFFSTAALGEDLRLSTRPPHDASPPSRTWRIGYLQGGDYIDYKETLLATLHGLVSLGWIPSFDGEKLSAMDIAAIWKWLAKNAASDYLRFVPDAFYTAGWAEEARAGIADAIRRRIQEKGDFEDSLANRSYAGISAAEQLSTELGFELVPCAAVSDIPDTAQSEAAYLGCLDKIGPGIDALYVTLHGGVTDNSIPGIIQKAERHRIATFSQSGWQEVEKGLLLSLSRRDFRKVGLFQAAIMANVFNGARPGELVQVFEEPLSISLNLDTAESIGYMPRADVIAAAEILYQKNKSRH